MKLFPHGTNAVSPDVRDLRRWWMDNRKVVITIICIILCLVIVGQEWKGGYK